MPVEVLEDTDELFICSGLHGAYTDNIAVIILEDNPVFVSFVGCDQ